MQKIKAIAVKDAIGMVRFLWMVAGFAITFYAMYVTAVTLGVCIPDGTSVWVRLAIGMPCMFVAPVSVEFLYIYLSKRLDHLTDYRLLNIR